MAWTIDSAHTTVGFSVRHLGLSRVRGQFTRFNGQVDLDGADLTTARGRVEIDVASIDTGNADRDQHLRSADFFDVENHPTMVFQLKRVEPDRDDRFRVTGDLTIRGVTHEVQLDYEHSGTQQDPWGNRKLGGELRGQINRFDWNLNWNVALEAGGVLVGDKVNIEVDGQLAESKEAIQEEAAAETGG